MKIVSIVMPAYNVEKYIAASIDSIIKQTYKNWELIIVNDGSTDTTPEIITAYAAIDSRIKIINQENKGVASARNAGLNHAKGKYISFLDSDDYYHPEYISLMSEPLNSKHIGLTFCKFQEVDHNNNILSCTVEDAHERFQGSFIDYISDTTVLTTANMAVMYKRDILNQYQIRFYEGASYAEDAEFLFKYVYLVPTNLVPHYLYNYVAREGSLSRRDYSYNMFFDEIDAYLRTIKFIQKHEGIESEKFISFLKKLILSVKNRIKRTPWRAIKEGRFEEALYFLNTYQNKYDHSFSLSFKEIDSKKFWLKIKILTSKNQLLWKLSKK